MIRAPGKLFLLGEYAVLEGYPAIVAAVDRHAVLQPTPRSKTAGQPPDLDMLAVTGDHKCKMQNAKCKVQSGQASWLSATIRLRTRLRRDFGDHPPSHAASAGLRRSSRMIAAQHDSV